MSEGPSRRLVALGMMGGLGGAGRRRPDQVASPPPMVLAPGGAAGTFRGRYVIIFGTGKNMGLFVYSSTPAAGNLVASIAAAAGTDPYGNAYQAGITSYGASSTEFIQMLTDTLQFRWTGTNVVNGKIYQASAVGLGFYPPAESLSDVLPFLLLAGNHGGGATQLLVSSFTASGATPVQGLTGALLEVEGALVAKGGAWALSGTASGAAPAGAETWIAASLENSWVNSGGGRPAAQYRQIASPPNTVEIIGAVTAPAGIALGQTIFTLPAGYRPSSTFSFVAVNASTNALVRISQGTTGTIFYEGGAAAGNIVEFHTLISLDA